MWSVYLRTGDGQQRQKGELRLRFVDGIPTVVGEIDPLPESKEQQLLTNFTLERDHSVASRILTQAS